MTFPAMNAQRLTNVIKEITAKFNDEGIHLTDELRTRLLHEQNQATKYIHAWKSHLLRTIVQDNAKQDILANLDRGSMLMIMDWAMKFQPMKFREQMVDFFGKRGRSWHVTCVIKGGDDSGDQRVEVETFVHLFDACIQDWFSIASIVEHTLKGVKMEDLQLPMFTCVQITQDAITRPSYC